MVTPNKPNWDKIRIEYVTKKISQRKLAEKHRVAYPTLRARSVREDWTGQRNDYCSKLVAKVAKKTEQKAEAAAEAIIDYNQQHIDGWAEFNRLVMASIKKRKTADAKLIPALAGVLEKIQKGQRLALNMDVQAEPIETALSDFNAALDAATEEVWGDVEEEPGGVQVSEVQP